ncbi:MAG: DUF4361 domain-containing protein [Bacteroidales bacterium]|nr:DUF4361 domain-containing protein [Candidatus Sodaliphilus aphodohippi]
MKKNLYIVAAILLGLTMTSCDENEQFRGELYKKVIYLLSNDDLTFETEHALGETSTGYVTVYCSGTEHIGEDVNIELEYDPEIVGKYNYTNYDLDSSRYAHELDPAKYSIKNLNVTLKANSPDNYALLPIEIVPDGLCPDSTYFIPLRIKNANGYEVNENKRSVMYRVILKNDYATMANITYYQVTGVETRHNSGSDVAGGISVTRILAPIAKNKVRFFAGTNTYNPTTVTKEEINTMAMVITLNDDHTIEIAPYGNLQVEKEDIDGTQTNYWEVNKRGQYVFHLSYRYYDSNAKIWISMTESCVQRN